MDLFNPSAYPSSQGSSSSSYGGASQNFTGIPGIENVLKPLFPTLSGFIGNMPISPGEYAANATGAYKNAGAQLLEGPLQQALNSLASRRIIRGSAVPETLALATKGFAPTIADKTFQAYNTGVNDIPQTLGALAALGRETTGDQSNYGMSNQQSSSQDPSVPYGQMYNFLASY